MASRRTPRMRARQVLSWDAVDGHQWTWFALGWSPGRANSFGWEAWRDYLATWLEVRDQALAERDPTGPLYFVEALYLAYGANGPQPWDRELLRAKDLLAADQERRLRGHPRPWTQGDDAKRQ